MKKQYMNAQKCYTVRGAHKPLDNMIPPLIHQGSRNCEADPQVEHYNIQPSHQHGCHRLDPTVAPYTTCTRDWLQPRNPSTIRAACASNRSEVGIRSGPFGAAFSSDSLHGRQGGRAPRHHTRRCKLLDPPDCRGLNHSVSRKASPESRCKNEKGSELPLPHKRMQLLEPPTLVACKRGRRKLVTEGTKAHGSSRRLGK